MADTSKTKFNSFFTGSKSIQRAYNFYVDIQPTPNQRDMPVIEPYHIRNASVPNFAGMVTAGLVQIGPLSKSYPIVKSEKIEFRLEMEEDDKATVQKFIIWSFKNYVNERGLHNYPDNTKLQMITITVTNASGVEVVRFKYERPFLQSADPISYAYDSGDSIKYILTFICYNYGVEFLEPPEEALIQSITNKV